MIIVPLSFTPLIIINSDVSRNLRTIARSIDNQSIRVNCSWGGTNLLERGEICKICKKLWLLHNHLRNLQVIDVLFIKGNRTGFITRTEIVEINYSNYCFIQESIVIYCTVLDIINNVSSYLIFFLLYLYILQSFIFEDQKNWISLLHLLYILIFSRIFSYN